MSRPQNVTLQDLQPRRPAHRASVDQGNSGSDLKAVGWTDEIYQKVRGLAASLLRHERVDHTLQATALAHEAFLRMACIETLRRQHPEHVCSMAVRTMRRILVDHARARAYQKRGGAYERVALGEAPDLAIGNASELVDFHHALERLGQRDETAVKVVELRCFGGFTMKEIAHLLSISESTAARAWSISRAWLHRQLQAPA